MNVRIVELIFMGKDRKEFFLMLLQNSTLTMHSKKHTALPFKLT